MRNHQRNKRQVADTHAKDTLQRRYLAAVADGMESVTGLTWNGPWNPAFMRGAYPHSARLTVERKLREWHRYGARQAADALRELAAYNAEWEARYAAA